MKKLLIAIAIIFGVFLFTYGSLAKLYNKGLGMSASLLVFGLTIVGGLGLVYFLRESPEKRIDADPEENTEKDDPAA
jgi:1,4-dihydroxy-2-naphthoate octaprenyltransferase